MAINTAENLARIASLALTTAARLRRQTRAAGIILVTTLPCLACSTEGETTAVLGGDASLRRLTVSSGALTPNFASDVTAYSLGVGNSTGTVTVTASANHNRAKIAVNGTDRGNAGSSTISLPVGTTTVTVLVTAENGITTRIYTIVITRAAPINA